MQIFRAQLKHNGAQLSIILRENFVALLKSIKGNFKSIIGTSLFKEKSLQVSGSYSGTIDNTRTGCACIIYNCYSGIIKAKYSLLDLVLTQIQSPCYKFKHTLN